MQHHHTAGQCRIALRHDRGNVFVRQTVESVAADAACGDVPRQRKRLFDGRPRVMKGGVEAGNLWQIGRAGQDGSDRRDVVRLMQRRERNQRFQRTQYVRIDPHRSDVALTAVHHPVSDRLDAVPLETRRQGLEQGSHGVCVAERCVVRPVFRLQGSAGPVLDEKTRGSTEPPDAASKHASQRLALFAEYRELDARGAGIDDRNGVLHGVRATPRVIRQPCVDVVAGNDHERFFNQWIST